MTDTRREQPNRKSQLSEPFLVPIWFYTVALFFFSLIVTGCGVFLNNHAYQVPLVHYLNNAALYPHDPYMPALARYASLLWPVVAWAARFIPLDRLLLWALLAERLFLLYAVGRLARALAPRSRLAQVGAMAAVACGIMPLLGQGTIMPPYFEQTGFAIACFLFAAVELLESRPMPCAIWLAVGFNLQSMYGIFALAYCSAAFATNEAFRRDWKKWAASFVLFLCLAAPGIFFGFRAAQHGAGDEALWLKISHVRSPWHLYPLTWSKTSFLRFGVTMVLLIALLGERKKSEGRLFQLGLAWSGVAILWLFYAFMAAYVVKSPSLLMLQAGRATDLWLCLAAVMLATTLALRVEENAIEGKPWKTVVIALFATLLFWRILDAYLLYALAVGLLVFVLESFSARVLANGLPGRVAMCLALSVFMISIHDVAVRAANADGIKRALFPGPTPSVEASAAWAKAHTPINAVFLVDPGSDDWKIFRGLSERSVFTTFIEGGAINWDRSFVAEWVQRIGALGIDLKRGNGFKDPNTELSERYQNLHDEDVSRLRARYVIDYWIVPEKLDSSFPAVFRANGFKVLKVGS